MKIAVQALNLTFVAVAVTVLAQPVLGQGGPPPLADRIAHSNHETFRLSESVHAGAGPMTIGSLLGANALLTNLQFVHRGVILPGGGIGAHFHNGSEEMFVILNEGEAEFTINGRTSRIRTPVAVPVTLGNSHALRNPTDQPLEWLNIAVSAPERGPGGSFDLNDPRVDVPLDPIPNFITFPLDHNRFQNRENWYGGTGTVQYRRGLQPAMFSTTWSYVDHMVLPPGTSVGAHVHPGMSEVFYVISGAGLMTAGQETAPIREGDAIPIHVGERHAIENSADAPLELLIVGIAEDMTKNLQTVDVD